MMTPEEVAHKLCICDEHDSDGSCHRYIADAIRRDRREQAQAVLPLVRHALWGGRMYSLAERKKAEAWLAEK